MAIIGSIEDLRINGSLSYKGPGPVTLTWSPPGYGGTFMSGPYLSLTIDDNDTWGPDGNPGPTDLNTSSYTLPDSSVEHVKQAGGFATIHVSVWGYDENYDFISSESNEVTFTYAETTDSKIKCYINGEWQSCNIKCYQNSNWINCEAKYYDGTTWH